MNIRLVVVFIMVVTVVGVVAFFSGHAWQNNQLQATPSTESEFDKLQALYQERMQLAVRDQLKDPESAQFRNLQYYPRVFLGKNGEKTAIEATLCGEVNAKNSYGGYTGYHSFFMTEVVRHPTADTTQLEFDDPADPDGHNRFQDKYRIECRSKYSIHEK